MGLKRDVCPLIIGKETAAQKELSRVFFSAMHEVSNPVHIMYVSYPVVLLRQDWGIMKKQLYIE